MNVITQKNIVAMVFSCLLVGYNAAWQVIFGIESFSCSVLKMNTQHILFSVFVLISNI